MEEEKLERRLSITKKGFPAIWVQTLRFAAPNVRYGYSSAICSPNGKLTKVIRTLENYTKVKHLVGISKKCVFIQSSYNIDGSVVEIYKVEELDFKNKKVILRKVATFKEGKWDNISYLNNYKVGIHSTLMRAKKFYSLMDLD